MTKYASNSMLACRISFMNEMANLCEHLGADIQWVRQGIATDRRIGPAFLFPGLGYGGSCFPKDIKALLSVAEEHHYPLKVVQAAQQVNELQKQVIIEKILKFYSSELAGRLEELKRPPKREEEGKEPASIAQGAELQKDYSYFLSLDNEQLPDMALDVEQQKLGSLSLDQGKKGTAGTKPLKGKTFAVWGLSFKPKTDDMREAPSRSVIEQLLKLGALVQVYDPEAMKEARKIFGKKVRYARNNYEALKDADALVLVTEWNVFRNPDFERIKKLLKYPIIFDGRNQYNPSEMRELGFLYFGIGRR